MNYRVITPARVVGTASIFAGVLLAVAAVSLFTGAAKIGLVPVIREYLTGVVSLSDPERMILFSVRLPRVIFAALVGGALSIAGVVFQALLRNPLADPYILGISGGSAVGAIIGIQIGATVVPFGIPGLAFLGALLTIFLVFAIARTGTRIQSNTLLLAGVIVNAFFSAVILFLISTSTNGQLSNIMFWLMGDLSIAAGGQVLFTAVCLLAGLIIIGFHARVLNLFVAGDETALQLGISVERVKVILFISASLVTAAAVSVSGIIGFVGLIIPHLMRMTVGSDHRLLIPASVFFGASFLLGADTIGRSVLAPTELPVGVITALCGAPYFIYLLKRKGA